MKRGTHSLPAHERRFLDGLLALQRLGAVPNRPWDSLTFDIARDGDRACGYSWGSTELILIISKHEHESHWDITDITIIQHEVDSEEIEIFSLQGSRSINFLLELAV